MILSRMLTNTQGAQVGEVAVVIDVLRAFSAEAVAFARGAREIIAVGTVEEALAWKTRDPSVLVMGEVNGYAVDGFDFWNSPTQLLDRDLTGRRLIHRTTAGTQGVIAAAGAAHLLVASFLVARATARYLVSLAPDQVDFIITGRNEHRDGSEDGACAEYIAALMHQADAEVDPAPYLLAARGSDAARRFAREIPPQPWLADLDFCLQVDRYPFAMHVWREGENLLIRRLDL